MKRTGIVFVTSLALALAAAVAPASPAAAACLTTEASRVTGGYVVSILCGGPIGIIAGYGSTPSDANLEALLLIQLFQDGGPRCTGLSVDKDGAVYWATLSCGRARFVDGQGETLTRAAQIARLTAATTGFDSAYPGAARFRTG